jgi:hypothetical protein
MERLRRQDQESGRAERSLTEAQKAALAEARSFYEAKLAEREILHRDALRRAQSHEEVARLNAELARDRERLTGERDRKLAEIRERG